MTIEDYFKSLEVTLFDPMNLKLLAHTPNERLMVFIREADRSEIHYIPNLTELKKDGKTQFVMFTDLANIQVSVNCH